MTEDETQLRASYRALQKLYRNDAVPEVEYFRSLICIAHRWIELGKQEEASHLLGQLTPAYCDTVLPRQMREDGVFHKIAHEVALQMVGTITDEAEAEIDILMLKGPVAKA